jgi:hypothetical protein
LPSIKRTYPDQQFFTSCISRPLLLQYLLASDVADSACSAHSLYFSLNFFRNESDVVNNLSEVFPIGTFAQIHEIQDLGDRLRLVVMAHRRIRLLGQIVDDSEAPPGMHV